jgi:tRNA (cmo5U34)-methyltransferase
MADAVQIFAEHAPEYHALRRRLVPELDDFYGTAADLLALRAGPLARVLDLGAGTGLLSAYVAERHPGVELVLVDGAAAMLEQARRLLEPHATTVLAQDLRDALPAGPFDAVVSALAIHHLDDRDKRDLDARVFAVLRPGGAFVNAEQVRGPTAWLTARQREGWLAACRRHGASEAELAQALERMVADRDTDTETQLRWLREAGYDDADCFYRRWHFAVIAGWRPADRRPPRAD